MTYNDILDAINHKIENSAFARFTQAQVISELNNTYRDIANKTNLFETYDFIKLENGRMNYTLPTGMSRPTRAVFRGKKLDFNSQEAMDLNLPLWETASTSSEVEALVYNNMSDKKITIYPRLTDVQVLADITEIEYIGELAEVYDNINKYLYLNSNTGAKYIAPTATAIVSDLIEVITIYGAFVPPMVTIAALESTRIFIDESNVNALIYGTAGNLLITIGRTEDRAKGMDYLKIYGLDETEVSAIRKRDFDNGFMNTNRKPHYRTPFQR